MDMDKKFYIEHREYGGNFLIYFPDFVDSHGISCVLAGKKALTAGLCEISPEIEGWKWDPTKEQCRLQIEGAFPGYDVLKAHCEACQKSVVALCDNLRRWNTIIDICHTSNIGGYQHGG